MRKLKERSPSQNKLYVILLFVGISVGISWLLRDCKWFIGLGVVAVFFGHFATAWVQKRLRKYAESYGVPATVFNITDRQQERHELQPVLVGLFERTFFTVLIAFQVPAVGAGLMLWLTVKMLSGWNRFARDTFPDRVRSFNALMMNLTSFLFAVLGGLIIHGDIQLSFLP